MLMYVCISIYVYTILLDYSTQYVRVLVSMLWCCVITVESYRFEPDAGRSDIIRPELHFSLFTLPWSRVTSTYRARAIPCLSKYGIFEWSSSGKISKWALNDRLWLNSGKGKWLWPEGVPRHKWACSYRVVLLYMPQRFVLWKQCRKERYRCPFRLLQGANTLFQ